MALFATMSFTLTSCGDDDDEPNNGGNTTSSLTINGKKYGLNDFFSQIIKSTNDPTWFWCQIDDNEGNELDIKLYNWDSISEGYVYSFNNEDIVIIWDPDSYSSSGYYSYFTSGSVKVVSLKQDANLVTLSFDNVKLVYEQDNKQSNSTVTINGNLTMPIKGHMYDGEMFD